MSLNRMNPKKRKPGNNKIYTPSWVAKEMVEYFKPTGKVLEPFKGHGVFTDLIPNCHWCEIDEGKDFYDWNEKVDWIISNPPYSGMREFILHSFKFADNIVYLVPVWKVFMAFGLQKSIREFGGIKEIRWYGTGSKLGFPMGNGIGAVHWKRNYKNDIKVSFYEA